MPMSAGKTMSGDGVEDELSLALPHPALPTPRRHCLVGQLRMEPLWIPAVATGGNRSQMARAQKPRNEAKTVAVGCDPLPREVHGKEGVDGSSPSEGSAKAPQTGAFSSARSLHDH
jgi:hypothetical protein